VFDWQYGEKSNRLGRQLIGAPHLGDPPRMTGQLTDSEHNALAGIAYRMANQILKDHAEAMDVASETMITLIARFEAPSNSESYVTTVAKNLAKNKQRGLSRQRRRLAFWADSNPEPGLGDPDRHLSQIVVQEAIKGLPDRQREAITYCYLEGMDRQAAAKKMGLEVASVKTHLKRAFSTLREELSEEKGQLK
jgi:RNA polymerase sigma-70 factor, ECF subfamily